MKKTLTKEQAEQEIQRIRREYLYQANLSQQQEDCYMTPEEFNKEILYARHPLGKAYYRGKKDAALLRLKQRPEPEFTAILLHVPHGSRYIPKEAITTYEVRLHHELDLLTDHYCDNLYACHHEMLTSPVSRLYCDMERFREDEEEEMAKVGMGAVYTRCSDGNVLRSVTDDEKEHILQNYYDVHHQKLTDMVEKRLQSFGKCLIIDGHSFHPEPLPHEPDQTTPRPDICIGTDDFHTPEWLTEASVAYWENLGYTVAVNSPFAGTIVPLQYYGKDKRVLSIMLEVNRKLYCYRSPMLLRDIQGYARLKSYIRGWIAKVEQTFLRRAQ